MNRLNEALDQSVTRRKLSNQDVVDALGMYTAASIGNYRAGKRKVPSDLVEKWKEIYGEDLHTPDKMFVSINKTNVSRETRHDFKETSADIQHILLESLKGINKLLDENGKLISDKRREVESLERVNNWALGQIDKLTSKLGVPKESQ